MIKTLLQRMGEAVLLGCLANVVVTLLFNPRSVAFSFQEFFIACVLFLPITELSRYLDHRLEKKIRWTDHPLRRFVTHLLLISFCLLLLLNTLGSLYMWMTGQGFFSWTELVIINVVTLCLALLLTGVKWAIHFYHRWVEAETKASESERMTAALKQRLTQSTPTIEVRKGTTKSNLEPKAITIAKIQSGVVRVYTRAGEGSVYPGTLSELMARLPSHLFFQVSRDVILHREVVKSISSSTFGKIHVVVSEGENNATVTVSRPKAASFRRWYRSISD